MFSCTPPNPSGPRGRISVSQWYDAGGSGLLQLQSDLWLDQPDAHDRIAEHRSRGDITADEAEQLEQFADLGYLTFSLDLDEAFSRGFDDDVARCWAQRPDDLAVSPPGPGGPTAFSDWD